jgi:hypothetical protein
LYSDTLRAKEVSGKLRTKIKNVLENQRSALEYLAARMTDAYGKRKGNIYYPLAQSEPEFDAAIDSTMPKVRDTRQDIADEIKKHQPYNTPELKELSALTRENKHNRLTPQTKTESVRREVRGPTGGGVSWDPGSVEFGSGVVIMGEPVDPVTQRTASTREITYVDWRFEELNLSVLETLRGIQSVVREAITAIRQVAAL